MDDRDQLAVAKQRLANFRFRQAPSSSITSTTAISNTLSTKSHSHSRNGSMTDSFVSTSSLNQLFLAEESKEHGVPNSPSPRSRPNSHHRRRSSVSTRRESAEMMGVAVPLETSSEAVGDQSELRRLALWTLEGKTRSDNPFIGSFTKVEIPELTTLDSEAMDGIQAPKPKPTLSAFTMGNALVGKRDSFGKLLVSSSSSLKDQLHTLMEEEEEEEEKVDVKGEEQATVTLTVAPDTVDDSREESSYIHLELPTPSRHRPANLTLRPLSLTPESLPASRTEALPTPSPTPSPRVTGLKALTLTPSPSPSPAPSDSPSPASSRRQSQSLSLFSQPPDYAHRRQSVGSFSSPVGPLPKRKSSISYKPATSSDCPSSYLPTPEPTPTSPLPPLHAALPMRSGSSSVVPDLSRPLSPSEQAFLFRSHTSLLSRISDLEQAIAGVHGRLPPGASVSAVTTASLATNEGSDQLKLQQGLGTSAAATTPEPEALSSQPSDEMLQLVSDLKSERDELMRDADGWRTRVADLEKQIGTLTRRVEAERREGWVIRERLGIVEVEKKNIKEEMEKERLECRRLEKALRKEELAKTMAEEDQTMLRELLKQEQSKRQTAEREAEGLRIEIGQLRARAEQADADLQSLLVTPKVQVAMQTSVVRRINSVDSQASTSSTTDVEEYVPVGLTTRKLNAVEEEDENRDLPCDVTSDCDSEIDNDELAHYEDDQDLDDDMIFGDDDTSSSFGSVAHSNSHLLRLDLAAVTPALNLSPKNTSSHTKTGSMERGWSFPHGTGPSLISKAPVKVDRFFECLDALEQSDADEAGGLPTYDSSTAKQFWRCAVKDSDDDEMPPFILPVQPIVPKKKEWKDIEAAKLEVVAEEAEEALSNLLVSSTTSEAQDAPCTLDSTLATPRAISSTIIPSPTATPTKHVKVRKASMDLSIPGFKPYSGSVPILKTPPPPKKLGLTALPTTPKTKSAMESTVRLSFPVPMSQTCDTPSSAEVSTPPKPRTSIVGTTFIPRLSVSPRTSPPKTSSAVVRTPTRSPTTPVSTTKLTPPSKPSTALTPPLFLPQPKTTNKSVTRSSPLPPKPPMLTRLSIPEQTPPRSSPTATPSFKQGLTATLSQQMHSLSNLWSPWNTSPSMVGTTEVPLQNDSVSKRRGVKQYVNKEQQLQKLKSRLRVEDVLPEQCEQCASCKGSVVSI